LKKEEYSLIYRVWTCWKCSRYIFQFDRREYWRTVRFR